ncbi:E3 ubiquitin-protein ligase WAVH1 [Impatiens glandulifera]|uniref:E3 ubiquitin-protein ligase WAVH1 n=1 Tax=Impatiens glandulifera TaxID=253017 RepID=UPI001FB0E799|nr:E3 ubiquitin-protein ligase WAVH1 [Impatiens glandulifera]
MVVGWRRAFCTSVTRDRESKEIKLKKESRPSPSTSTSSFASKLSFFSNPSTPRLQLHPLRCQTAVPSPSLTNSPTLQCKTNRSTPSSSPRSPFTFSLLKSTLRLSKTRCGICFHSVKSGQGTAIFTAECSHSFHFPCIASQVKKQGNLSCPVCCSIWKELPVLNTEPVVVEQTVKRRTEASSDKKLYAARSDLKIYNDDEPLSSPKSGIRFNPIPETDENDEEFKGFFTDSSPSSVSATVNLRNVEAMLLPETVMVSTNRNSENYAVVLKVKAPPSPARNSLRAPIDLVTVLDVGCNMTSDKVQAMKRAMRLIVSSLSSTDRLSIVAFSANSKRLLPLRRMSANGRSSARRIIEAIISCQGKTNPNDAVKKAIKVIEDRRDRNPVSSIILMSDVDSSTRFSHLTIPVHSIKLDGSHGNTSSSSFNDDFAKSVLDLLNVVVQDLRIQLAISSGSGSSQSEIVSVYSLTGRTIPHHSGSIKLGDLHAEEEREVLIEMKVPSSSSSNRSHHHHHHILTVRCFHKDPSTEELIYDKVQPLLIPPPITTVRSSSIKTIFVFGRALAESRRLIERNDLTGAHNILESARGLIRHQCAGQDDLVRSLEAAVADLQCRRRAAAASPNLSRFVDEKGEPLTPTSAWRAAEKLAKVAMMRKSMNRVGDLHGFENARF